MRKTDRRIVMAVSETLESRRLLTSSLSAGVLTITGTSGNNTIDVSLVSTKIRVKESGLADKDYTASQVTKISVDGKAGNDKITIGSTITKPTSIIGGSGNDTVSGGGGKDTVKGGDGNDSLSGNDNNDALQAENGNDTLRGGAGVDGLLGGAGDDVLDGGLGNDYMDGQAGNDTADYAARTVAITAEIHVTDAAAPLLVGAGGQSGEHDSFATVETLAGGGKADTLTVTALDRLAPGQSVHPSYLMLGNGGDDTLTAQAPDDNLDCSASRVTLHGGDGKDTLNYLYLISTAVYGDGGDDEIDAASSWAGTDALPTTVVGGTGHDVWFDVQASIPDNFTIALDSTLEDFWVSTEGSENISVTGNSLSNAIHVGTEGGSVTVNGGDGNDIIEIRAPEGTLGPLHTLANLGKGNDRFEDKSDPEGNYPSPDTVYGGDGNDTILGGRGNDSLSGGFGNDSISGDLGNDFIDGDIGGFQTSSDIDTLSGGDGNDTIYSSDTGTNLVHGDGGNDSLYGSTKLDTIFGDAGNDLITGSSGNDELHGGAGNDTIQAGDGDDKLFGDAGNDLLQGQNGNDTLNDLSGILSKDKDTLDGGDGSDVGTGDTKDIFISVEKTF